MGKIVKKSRKSAIWRAQSLLAKAYSDHLMERIKAERRQYEAQQTAAK